MSQQVFTCRNSLILWLGGVLVLFYRGGHRHREAEVKGQSATGLEVCGTGASTSLSHEPHVGCTESGDPTVCGAATGSPICSFSVYCGLPLPREVDYRYHSPLTNLTFTEFETFLQKDH